MPYAMRRYLKRQARVAALQAKSSFGTPSTVTDADIWRILGEERFGALDALQQIRGIDALGWYMTFHQRSSQHGVHIPVEGVLWLVLNVFDKVRLPLARRIEIAFHAILRHEIFHFAADCMAANWELATGVEVYWSSRGHQNALGHIELEEGLANAYMLRGFKHPSRLLVMSRVIGYRCVASWVTDCLAIGWVFVGAPVIVSGLIVRLLTLGTLRPPNWCRYSSSFQTTS
ncbi:hypothetical protein [Mycobacterium sp. TY814]|uniref:hypothetical protein n=1 Tax=unclassified Mycobacterium TaxID=2642494 RepID=UPI0027425793|nr:hypothetical protein [Mycobacterium sp. TY814]MDP7724169.1 hypothetical protein [Mycobacterium sp. TY814]